MPRARVRLASLTLTVLVSTGCGATVHRAAARRTADPVVVQAGAEVQRQLGASAAYDGPTSGPSATRGKLIVFVAADITNGGIAGVAEGAQQATSTIGWRLRILDGQASVAGRTRAMGKALALRPDGIILGGFDAGEQAAPLRLAEAKRIPVVGWHSGARPGPNRGSGLFTNVSTDPLSGFSSGRAPTCSASVNSSRTSRRPGSASPCSWPGPRGRASIWWTPCGSSAPAGA